MGIMDIIRQRHSVREYTDRPIEGQVLEALEAAVEEVRQESGLDIQLLMDNPEAFDIVASFGLIHGCKTCIAFVADGKKQDEAIGYWGQKIVLHAQELGLNTCWVGMFSKGKCKAVRPEGQKPRVVIAVGYGVTPGHERKTKPLEELCTVEGGLAMPEWFAAAMEAAQLAPTAMNAQSFRIDLRADGETVAISAKPSGYRTLDKGIVKYNFEVIANEFGAMWRWE